MNRVPNTLAALTAAALLVGCSGEGIGGVQLGSGGDREREGDGTFEAQVSGLVTGSFEGAAVFGTDFDPETGIALWVMNLVTAEGSPQGVHFVRRGERPVDDASLGEIDEAGRLPDTRVGGIFLVAEGVLIRAGFFSTRGDLRIVQSTEEVMEGTFDFSGRGYLINPDGSVEEGDVQVSGSFDALPGDVFVPPTR